jgi:hypothetical protein
MLPAKRCMVGTYTLDLLVGIADEDTRERKLAKGS